MKILRLLFHFLGSVPFAITLISMCTLAVISGTVIESITDSHDHAAKLTYNNPGFQVVLGLFFVNILFAALRRWPFKLTHIPFLITHLGLLMVISGTLVKTRYGTQGVMSLLEGGETNRLLVKEKKVLHVERGDRYVQWPVSPEEIVVDADSGLHAKLLGFTPHGLEVLNGWVKGDFGTAMGLPPLPLGQVVTTHLTPDMLWEVRTLRTPDVDGAIEEALRQSTLHLSDSQDRLVLSLSLQEALQAPVALPQGDLEVQISGETVDYLWNGTPLRENEAWLGSAPIEPRLERRPSLLLIDDTQGNEHVVTLDPYGRVHRQLFARGQLTSYLAYDRGYSGYGLTAKIPLLPPPSSLSGYRHLGEAVEQWLAPDTPLSPPLQLLRDAAGDEFVETWIAFLQEWDRAGTWFLPENRPLPAKLTAQLDKVQWTPPLRKSAQWLTALQEPMIDDFLRGKPLQQTLQEMEWPLLDELAQLETPEDLLMAHGQQILAIADQLPDLPDHNSDATLLSALMRSYGLHYRRLMPPDGWEEEEPVETIELECTVSRDSIPEEPSAKWEENTPQVTFSLEEEELTLTYDRTASGLKWPALNGELLVRYQPAYQEIPYSVRLRTSRQINYAGATQAFAYESRLIVTDTRSGREEATTISMNNVHETWDGYRFYMSGLTQTNGTAAKRAQLAVNYDPAKYKLTYPGGLVLSLGILLLFGKTSFQKRST